MLICVDCALNGPARDLVIPIVLCTCYFTHIYIYTDVLYPEILESLSALDKVWKPSYLCPEWIKSYFSR